MYDIELAFYYFHGYIPSTKLQYIMLSLSMTNIC